MKDLKKIGYKVYRLTLRKRPWRPTTADIRSEFMLTHQQVTAVKRYAKQFAAADRVMWGWDPELEYFRVAPTENAPEVAQRMLRYVYGHAYLQMFNLNHLLPGAVANRYVSASSGQAAQKRNARIAEEIMDTFYGIEFL